MIKNFILITFFFSFSFSIFGQTERKILVRTPAQRNAAEFEYKGEIYRFDSYKKDVPQQDISSEMHRNNIGKIIFSDEKIEFQNEDESKIKNRFNISDHIYGRAYMICSVANDTIASNYYNYYGILKNVKKRACGRGGRFANSASAFYKLYIDGELSNWNIQNISFNDKSLQYTTRQVWLAPETEDEKVSDYWLEILDDLSEGEHSVRIELFSDGGNFISYRPLAAGEFTLVKGKNANTVSAGLKFSALDEGRKDPELAKQILGILNKKAKGMGWEMTFKKVKMRTDWISSYVGSGNSLSRIREISVYGYATYPDGRCIIEEFTIAQSYNGSEFSGPIFYRQVIPGSKQRIDCE